MCLIKLSKCTYFLLLYHLSTFSDMNFLILKFKVIRKSQELPNTNNNSPSFRSNMHLNEAQMLFILVFYKHK